MPRPHVSYPICRARRSDSHTETPMITATTASEDADRDLVDVDQQHLDADDISTSARPYFRRENRSATSGQQEIHRAQAEDGEDVGGQDDERSVVMAKMRGMESTAKISQ